MLRMLYLISLINICKPLAVSNYTNITEKEETQKVNLGNSSSKDTSSALRIVGGRPARLGQFPYFVSVKALAHKVYYPGLYGNLCGGCLIALNKVVSAARCFTMVGNKCERQCRKFKLASLQRYFMVAGALTNFMYPNKGGQWRKVRHVSIPKRHWGFEDDIAVAFTDTPFIITQGIAPIPYASAYLDYYENLVCETAGFGRTSKSKPDIPSALMWAKQRLMSTRMCSKKIRKDMHLFVCSFPDKYGGALDGDTGNPVVCKLSNDPHDQGRGVLVGVMSHWHTKNIGAYTRVSNYMKLLASNRGCQTPCPVSKNIWFLIVCCVFYQNFMTTLTLDVEYFCKLK